MERILARLAASQERASEARRTVVYQQEARVRFLRTNGKLAREERRLYTVIPAPKGTEKKLVRFGGRYERNGRILFYGQPGFTSKDLDLDGELISDLTDVLIHDNSARDGISADLFPLTSRGQSGYQFAFGGCRMLAGKPAFHLTFSPRRVRGRETKPWQGEAFVDPAEFQPLRVTTELARNVPAAVRILFGISIRQLGFSVTFVKAGEDLWFPATYGAEFGLRVLFGYRRNITMNVVNSGFRRTAAESTITFPAGLTEQ